MTDIFTVDGKSFPSVGVESLERVADIHSRNEYEMLSGMRRRDITGTYFTYSLKLSTLHMNRAEYDRLYELLVRPTEVHAVTLPYAQSMRSFDAMIYTVSDEVSRISEDGTDWHELTVTFAAQRPVLSEEYHAQ